MEPRRERVIEGPRRRAQGPENVDEGVDDVPLGADDGAVVLGGSGGLDYGRGGGGAVVAVREEEGVVAGDGEVEEGGGGVDLGRVEGQKEKKKRVKPKSPP